MPVALMRSSLRTTAAGLLAVVAFAASPAGASAAPSCAGADAAPAETGLAATADSTLCLLNAERARRRLAPLTRNALLDAAAIRQSRDMVARQYFAHESPGGTDATDRIRATGYLRGAAAWIVGENLAWGTGSLATPRGIVTAWMTSPGHRQNVLRARYREIGLGIVAGNPQDADGGGATYATTFGARSRPAAKRARKPVRSARRVSARASAGGRAV